MAWGQIIQGAIAVGGSLFGGRQSKVSAAERYQPSGAGGAGGGGLAYEGFNYLKGSPVGTQYLPAGAAANEAQAALLGLDTGAYSAGAAAPETSGLDWRTEYLKTPEGQNLLKWFGDKKGSLASKFGITTPQQLVEYNFEKSGGEAGPMAAGVAAAKKVVEDADAEAAAGSKLSTQPYGGGDSKSRAEAAYQNYLQSTGHQFRLKTGMDAITGNRATTGALNSGATLRALTQYGQNLGTSDFQNYFQNLGSLSQSGLTAGNVIGGAAGAAGANAQAAADAAAARAQSEAQYNQNRTDERNAGILAGVGEVVGGIGNWWKNRGG